MAEEGGHGVLAEVVGLSERGYDCEDSVKLGGLNDELEVAKLDSAEDVVERRRKGAPR